MSRGAAKLWAAAAKTRCCLRSKLSDCGALIHFISRYENKDFMTEEFEFESLVTAEVCLNPRQLIFTQHTKISLSTRDLFLS